MKVTTATQDIIEKIRRNLKKLPKTCQIVSSKHEYESKSKDFWLGWAEGIKDCSEKTKEEIDQLLASIKKQKR